MRLCFADFFTLFEVPFRYGGPLGPSGRRRQPEAVIVIDADTNRRLFGGANSVGQTRQASRTAYFTVVGVLAPWRPAAKYYDPHNGAYQRPEAIFMPFGFGVIFEADSNGNTWGWQSRDDDSFEGLAALGEPLAADVGAARRPPNERSMPPFSTPTSRATEGWAPTTAAQQPALVRDGVAGSQRMWCPTRPAACW